MDFSGAYDDEVVADSEEEEFNPVLTAQPSAGLSNLPTSHISNPTAITSAPSLDHDTIQSFEVAPYIPSAIDSTFSDIPSTRPKPRPVHKKNAADTSASSGITSPRENTVTSSTLPTYVEFGSSNIADRAKMRSRNTKPLPLQPEILELSSDDDFNLLPPSKTKARPKKSKAPPRPKSKAGGDTSMSEPKTRPQPRPVKSNKRSNLAHPSSPLSGPTSDGTLPRPSSSVPDDPLPIPFHLLPSQLPPSDPPSTATTYDHPPIETLPNLDTDLDAPTSSPSSLFSVASPGKRKRRVISRVDELDSDADDDLRSMPPPPLPGPPPTFFAGSSSPSAYNGTHISAIDTSTEKPPAVKKPRKKKGEAALRNDENPPKPKPKGRSKATKIPQRVEVVIERRPKGKGKEKEVFKSQEFIEDDDETDGGKIAIASAKPDSLTSLSSVPDSEPEAAKAPRPSKKRKSVGGSGDQVHDKDGYNDEPAPKKKATSKGKAKVVVSDDDEDYATPPIEPPSRNQTAAKVGEKRKGEKSREAPKVTPNVDSDVEDQTEIRNGDGMSKENIQPAAPKVIQKPNESLFPSLSSRYTIAPKTKSTPMSDLIRRVNSMPGSPFRSPAPRPSNSKTPRPSTPGTAYSPYVKSSRSALSRIAPLHPNRRTPPPPLPPPPPPKKTKKEKEREEQWEEELIESVGGITEWACMTDAERKELRRAKRERETAGWEE